MKRFLITLLSILAIVQFAAAQEDETIVPRVQQYSQKYQGMTLEEQVAHDWRIGKRHVRKGRALTIAGVACLGAGGLLVGLGYYGVGAATNVNVYMLSVGAFSIGTLAMIAGIPFTSIGVALWVSGSIKKRNAIRDGAGLNIQLGYLPHNGNVGLVMNF